MALQGTLKDFGIADIFQLISQQQKVGVLHLTEGEREVHVAFKDGNVVRAESATRKKRELLGDMLVRAGLITRRQLDEALEEQKRTLRRVGDILVGSGAVTREALRDTAQLQTCETLYTLFTWKSGHYEFEATEVDFDPQSIVPIRSETVLIEGFRRVDEWPVIRNKISSTTMTFERVKPLEEASGESGEDVDRALDDAFGGATKAEVEHRVPQSDGMPKNLGPNEQQVYGLAEPGRDVRFVIDRSRLGEFEACKALFRLVSQGFLKPVADARLAGVEVGASESSWTDRLVFAVGQLAMTSVLLAAVVFAFTRVNWSAPHLRAAGETALGDPALGRFLGRSQRSRIEAAIAEFAAVRGAAPESLQDLVSQGILTQADLRYPWREGYYYRKTGERTFVLLPPLR